MSRWGVSLIGFAIAFFCIFIGVNASIAGDSLAFLSWWLLGSGAVGFTVGLNRFVGYRSSIERLQTRTDEIRDHYDGADDGVVSPDAGIDPATIYPEWQKCNTCGVYLRDHGTKDHEWKEWAGGEGPKILISKNRDWDDEPEVRETEQEQRDRIELKKRIEKNRQENMMGKPHVHRQVPGRPCVQCEAKRRWH